MEDSYSKAIQDYEKNKPFYLKSYFAIIINAVVILVFTIAGWAFTIDRSMKTVDQVAENQQKILEIINGNGHVGLVGRCEQNKLNIERLTTIIDNLRQEIRNLD